MPNATNLRIQQMFKEAFVDKAIKKQESFKAKQKAEKKDVKKQNAAHKNKNKTQNDHDTLPIASSTANSYRLKNVGNSMLGDTQASSSVASQYYNRPTSNGLEPIYEQTENELLPETSSSAAQKNTKGRKKKTDNKKQKYNNMEHSRIQMKTPAPVDHLNDVFNQLKNASNYDDNVPDFNNHEDHHENQSKSTASDTSSGSTKKLRVRLKRLQNLDKKNKQKETRKSETTQTERVKIQ